MAQKTKSYLYDLWVRGYKPLEQDFKDFFDSFWHKDESIPQAKVTDLVQALDDRQLRSEKGQGNGYAGLDNTAKVPLSQLPDFAFLIKRADFASLDVTGAERNIYLTENDNKLYYWNGTAYELLSDTSNYQLVSEKNTANGYVGLNGSTKIDATYLPSFVDDVIEVADFASLPLTGETGKIYLTLDDNKIFRWSGTVYVEISAGAIPTIQAVLEAGNEVSTDTLIKNGNAILQLRDSTTGVTNFNGQLGNGTNYGNATVKSGTNTRGTVDSRMETIVPGVTSYFRTYPALVESKVDNGSGQSGYSATPSEAKLFVKNSFARQQENSFRSEAAIGADSYVLDIGFGGFQRSTTQGANTTQYNHQYNYHFVQGAQGTKSYAKQANLVQMVDTIQDNDLVTPKKAVRLLNPVEITNEQHDVINDTYTKVTQTSLGLRYIKVVAGVTIQDIYLNEQTISALQFVDDSFTSQAVTGAIGSTGASVTFTTALKHIPYVFLNGLRFKVGVNATPANNICFFGPDASTVRTSLGAIVSGDLLFWNPLFANSFDLATTDEIILNYTKV